MKPIHKQAMEAALSNGGKYHVACVLYRRGKPVYIGINTDKTHPRFRRIAADGTEVCTLHAEMSALRFSQPGDSLEVMRFLKDGTRTMAQPCVHCMHHIRRSGLSRVKYTTWDGSWGSL
jgi:cytidine deaminase